MYAETYNVKIPKSACKISNCNNVIYAFNLSQSESVHFPIASEQPDICQIFLMALPSCFYHYDAFYVLILSCPLGFTLQHGVCDCDPDLQPYIDGCSINDQTVTRLPNVYKPVLSKELPDFGDYA